LEHDVYARTLQVANDGALERAVFAQIDSTGRGRAGGKWARIPGSGEVFPAMTETDPIVIVAAVRTPIGGFQGDFKDLAASSLGAVAVRAALARSGVPPEDIEELILGCVLPAGQGQAPARQAALAAGLPEAVPCTTLNKMCGSGMKAIMLAHDVLRAGSARIAVAGGMESMSNAPYLLDRARSGYRMGHGKILDHMFVDGLEDAYGAHLPMGAFAEDCAECFQFTRAAQDAFAIASLERAQQAIKGGGFEKEIAPVAVRNGKSGDRIVSHDEQPLKARLDKIPFLKPVFREDGTVTAANSSSISDGAAALILMRRSEAEQRGIAPLAAIVAHATHAQAPSQFATAPIGALRKLMDKTGWSTADVDLFEINEAFAVVTMAAMQELSLPRERVNVHGGACALGHPIGASGARIVVTLLAAMEKYGMKRGAAALCIGGGEATAIALETP
jgi:acetyl-CoA C-acetyltransferase